MSDIEIDVRYIGPQDALQWLGPLSLSGIDPLPEQLPHLQKQRQLLEQRNQDLNAHYDHATDSYAVGNRTPGLKRVQIAQRVAVARSGK